MKVDCIPCFVKQIMREIDGSDLDEGDRENIMKEMLSFLSQVNFDIAPVDLSYKLHQRMVDLGVSDDPYHGLKVISTEQALKDLEVIEKEIKGSVDPLFDSALAALAGNVIDYGAKNMLDLHDVLDQARREGFAKNDWEIFIDQLSNAKVLYYLLDNSGEVVFDDLFMKKLTDRFPDLRIKAVVKRTPLLNDVTREDVELAGLVDGERMGIMEVPGKGWIKPEHIEELRETGSVFLSKGQGNYESLSEMKDIFFLLVVKCGIVSRDLNVDVGEMVFKYS
ncbi:MAG: ARMT1-like domain-containing protein [Thermoplasmatota archaeon]